MLGQLKAAACWRHSALHIEYDFQVSTETNSFDDINYKDPYRDMVCFFSQDQHLFLNLFVTLNKSDQKMGEILFLCITQPEKIRETKKFFDWILLLPDAFSG